VSQSPSGNLPIEGGKEDASLIKPGADFWGLCGFDRCSFVVGIGHSRPKVDADSPDSGAGLYCDLMRLGATACEGGAHSSFRQQPVGALRGKRLVKGHQNTLRRLGNGKEPRIGPNFG
jgi:hypothetical protein